MITSDQIDRFLAAFETYAKAQKRMSLQTAGYMKRMNKLMDRIEPIVDVLVAKAEDELKELED